LIDTKSFRLRSSGSTYPNATIRNLKNLNRVYFVGTKVTGDELERLQSFEFIGSSKNICLEAMKEFKESLPLFKKNKAG
jgi:hypothetical protein